MTARLLDRMRRLGWPRLPVLAAASGALLSLRGGANRGHDQPSGATRGSGPRLFPLLLAWLLLLVLLAVEFGISFLAIGRPARPLILVPAALMVAVVGSVFMQVARGPTIVRLFATAALLWLAILLGLGSLDALTRTDYRVQAYSAE